MQIMPFEAAKTYRFNPFDLTKVWPHGDYPLNEVGRLTLDRNVDGLPHRDRAGRVRAEQPRPRHRVVPGQDAAGPRLLLLRRAPRATRRELQADSGEPPEIAVHSYCKDGAMRMQNVSDPVYAPNSYGGPQADPSRTDDGGHWYADGDMVRTAYTCASRTTIGSARHARA